ncbi:MAG: signal peptidase I [Candidatus Taylorbacteria bacterium CG10_big_fil_rev_8_21_14_0_10_41_48]|uniref:Signal peptidase I n=1 Tax=Candidatus Taylorbacteria bacterium CG10_big_fil_rev_8_21_14_0_10_41_48 TaxID=1975024 RepID=A0A2M8LBX7_9BACT|nr:MAG: signal peptidase I [Candidatus Taylorbacteria bacterium CG10_big_fil_rev_8_21_14_0_10_41_48]
MKLLNKHNLIALAVVTFVVVLAIRLFVFEAFFVQGDSMAPTILSGDFVLVNKLAYIGNQEPSRGDIIIAIPRVLPQKVVKRVIGLPGERFEIINQKIVIKNSRTDEGVTIDEPYLEFPNTPEIGKVKTTIDPNEYFVLGDNRNVSIDSRELGMMDRWDIKGRVFGGFSFKRLKYIGF